MTPDVTVVVPVNGVEGQLRECLDALVGQTLGELEIIAINDASRDGSYRILDEFDQLHENVRVVRNDVPIGPGPCRNLGLSLAAGRFIGFVDGDDWVSADFYEAAFNTATNADADVVVLDHVRAFPNGTIEPNRSQDTLRSAPVGAFSIEDHPDLLRNIPTVWNKLFRTEFLRRPEFTFDEGWYEDVPVTNLALCTADRIAVARTGLYYYRQRPSSILFSKDDGGHIVVVDRYRHLLDDLVARGVEDRLLRHIFAYSVWHLRLVENRGLRRFTENGLARLRTAIVDYFDQYGHLFAAGLVTKADAAWFRSLSEPTPVAQPVADPVQRLVMSSRRRVAATRKKYRSEKIKWRRDVFYGGAKRERLDPRLVAFASFWFESPAGNPLAIYEELVRRAPSARCMWILTGKAPTLGLERHSYVRQGWREYYDLLGRATYFVNNVNFPNFVDKREGSVELQTTHGTPLKVMGIHESRAPASNLDIDAMLDRTARWDYCLSANPYSSEIWQGAYPTGFRLLETGYPRNDILHRYSELDVRKVRTRLGIGPDEFVILYAPTYRQLRKQRVSPSIDLSALAEAAGPSTRLLNRSHYFLAKGSATSGVLDVSDYPITNELLIACDLLITDYSSIMFDFAALRRPIINFVPDCDDYIAERGTYFDIRTKNAGLVTADERELRSMVQRRVWDDEAVRSSIEAFADEFVGFDDGFAASRVVEEVFGDLLEF